MDGMTEQPRPTAASVYADLRRRGKTAIVAEHASVISGVRRLAKANDLAVSQYRERLRPGMSRYQARQRPYHLSLTCIGSDFIVTPDAVDMGTVRDQPAQQPESTGPNATITVTYGDGSVTFDLEGTELSATSHGNAYLGNASRDFIATEVEKALIEVTSD